MFSLILMFVTLASVGNMLTFMVGSKQAFEVSLADVAQTQMQGKTDVLLSFMLMILLEPMRFVVDSSCSGSTHIFCIANEVLVDLIWIHVADTVDLSLMNH